MVEVRTRLNIVMINIPWKALEIWEVLLTKRESSAKDIECIVADAGARSQGAMAGSAVAAGVLVPAAMSIPYIGWLAGGWVSLLGNNIGSELGSTVKFYD